MEVRFIAKIDCKIAVKQKNPGFLQNEPGWLNSQAYVSVCYGKLELPLTYSEKEIENAWVSALYLHGPQWFSAS